ADFLTANKTSGGQQLFGSNNLVVATSEQENWAAMRKFFGERRDHLARRRRGERRPQEGSQRNQGAPSVQSSHGPTRPGTRRVSWSARRWRLSRMEFSERTPPK